MSTDNVHQVIIADSQFLVVEALKTLIGLDERFSVAGVVATNVDLYPLLDHLSSGLIITNLENIDFDGMDDLKNIRQKYPKIAIMLLVNSISKQEFSVLTKLGIKNIIYKTADKDELFSALEATVKGKKFYSDEILDLFLEMNEYKNTTEDPKHLTSSETEIVKLIAGGLTTKEIALKRNISHHTVNTHRKNIFKKA